MIVKCIHDKVTEELKKEFSLPSKSPRFEGYVTIGKEYITLGIQFIPDLSLYGGGPRIWIKDDTGDLAVLPMFMFEVVNPSASIHWRYEFHDRAFSLLPESFLAEFYREDLSDDKPDIVADFKNVCGKLECEEAAAIERRALERLQNWQSRGSVEGQGRSTRVSIQNLENASGWTFVVQLVGTYLENVPFDIVDIQREDSQDWVYCWVNEGCFDAACGPGNLGEVITRFMDWADAHPA